MLVEQISEASLNKKCLMCYWICSGELEVKEKRMSMVFP